MKVDLTPPRLDVTRCPMRHRQGQGGGAVGHRGARRADGVQRGTDQQAQQNVCSYAYSNSKLERIFLTKLLLTFLQRFFLTFENYFLKHSTILRVVFATSQEIRENLGGVFLFPKKVCKFCRYRQEFSNF